VLLAGIEANSQHRGLPLTLKERKHAAELLLKTHTDWSDRRIAQKVGLDHKTIAQISIELEAKGEITRLESRIDTLGRQQAKKRGVGKIPTSEEEIEPEPPPPPWKDKLFCPADALELLPHEPKHHYDLILADPPYNITSSEDFADMDEYLEFTRKWLSSSLKLNVGNRRLTT